MFNPGNSVAQSITFWTLVILGGYLIGGTNGRVRNYGFVVFMSALWPAGYLLHATALPSAIDTFFMGVGDVIVWTIPIFLLVAWFARLAKSKFATVWGTGFAFAPLVAYVVYFIVHDSANWSRIVSEVFQAHTAGRVVGVIVGAVLMFRQIGYARQHPVTR